MFLSAYLFSSFHLLASATPTFPTLPLNTSSTVDNSTTAAAQPLRSGPLPVPTSFGIKPGAFGPELDSTACLFNAVGAFAELALDDYHGPSGSTVFHFPNHPSVVIAVVTPASGVFIERRFAIWGIWLGIAYMISHHRFQAATFALSWEDVIVGAVDFGSQPTISGDDGDGKVNNSLTILNATTTTSPVNAQAQNLEVLIGLVGRSINVNNIILVLLATLNDAAQYRATDVIPAQYRIGLHGYTALFSITPEPRTTAPFPEYEWLIRALEKLPDFMLRNRKFSEANVVVRVDGVVVIDASLVDVGSGPSNLNASDVETA